MFITNQLRDEIGELNKSKGWHDEGKRTIATHCILLHSEVSEIVEDYRNNNAINYVWYEYEFGGGKFTSKEKMEVNTDTPNFDWVLGKPCGIPSELADVVIRALDMAYEYEEEVKHGDVGLSLNIYDNESFEFLLAELHNLISHLFYSDEINTLNDITTFCEYIANRYNINLEQQILDKLAYNRTRPARHGNKRL